MTVLFAYEDKNLLYHHSLDETPDPKNFYMHTHETY